MRVEEIPSSARPDHRSPSDPRSPADPRSPTWLGSALGFTALLTATASLVTVGSSLSTTASLVLLATVVAVLAWSVRPAAALVTGLLAWPFLNGFVVGAGGVLSWHGRADVVRLIVLVGTASVVTLVRAVLLRRSLPQRGYQPQVVTMPATAAPTALVVVPSSRGTAGQAPSGAEQYVDARRVDGRAERQASSS